MRLQALRGDMEGLKAALQALPPVSGNANDRVEISRFTGYQKLVGFLLRLDRPENAFDVAKTAPGRFRTYSLLYVAFWYGDHGRIDGIRAILSFLGDKLEPKMRDGFLRPLALATAKSGDVASAIAIASQATDPARHRDILFEVAQTIQ